MNLQVVFQDSVFINLQVVFKDSVNLQVVFQDSVLVNCELTSGFPGQCPCEL